jgi:hypothetical protein
MLCAPVLLLLYDGLHYARFPMHQAQRILMVVGLGFVAVGFDIALAIHENQQMKIYEDTYQTSMAAPSNMDTSSNMDASKQKITHNVLGVIDKQLLLTICTGDNARSATWWTWFLWILIASSLFVTSAPVQAFSSQIMEVLVPGTMTCISLAVIAYIAGMPVVSRVPGMNIDNTISICWMEDRHTTSLSLCLAVDFFTRCLLTFTLTYWLVFDAVS